MIKSCVTRTAAETINEMINFCLKFLLPNIQDKISVYFIFSVSCTHSLNRILIKKYKKIDMAPVIHVTLSLVSIRKGFYDLMQGIKCYVKKLHFVQVLKRDYLF